jgi:hypothetical protein
MSGNAAEGAMGYNENGKSDLSSLSYLTRGWNKPSLVGYMESHDEERMVYKCLNYGNSSGSYNIKELPVALKRAALAAALFIPVPGPKMIWQFGELGYDISIDSNGRLGEKPIHWDYTGNADRNLLYQVFSELFMLKKKFPIFATSSFTQSLGGEIKWIKLNLNDEHVLIAGNFGVTSANTTLEFQKTGTWYDFFGKKSFNVPATTQAVVLAPGEFKLYSTRNFGSTVTAINNDLSYQNDLIISPNPANDFFRIVSSVNTKRVGIYALSGSKVRDFLWSDTQGSHEIYIGDLHSGMYLLEVQNVKGQTSVRKLIKRP